MSHRVERIKSHILSKSLTSCVIEDANKLLPEEEEFLRNSFNLMKNLENRMLEKKELPKLLPGPLDELSEEEITFQIQKAFLRGQNMLLVESWTEKYGKNIVFPMTITPKSRMPYRDFMVVVSDPEDVSKVLQSHVKKSDIYGVAFLGDGVLSTRDNELWREQRRHLQDAFLPNTVMATEVFPISLQRAKFAARDRMRKTIENTNVVEINEFLLHEAMAQLQLALIGESEEEMERFNIPLRRAHENSLKFRLEGFEESLQRRTSARKVILDFSNQVLSHHPQGPLGKRLVDNCPFGKDDPKIKRDTVSTFNFAG